MSKHLKRITMPTTWPMQRKGSKFVTKPNPGPHSLKYGLSLGSLLKEILGYAENSVEIKHILNQGLVTVDGKKRADPKFPVGLMDVIKNEKTGEGYRVLLNTKAKLCLVPIPKDEFSVKPCKIARKTMISGKKLQVTLHDGRNLLADNAEYKVGDTIMIHLPDGEPKGHFRLGKGAFAIIINGKHTGEYGVIEEIIGKESIEKTRIMLKTKDGEFETLTEYAFVIGEGKPAITMKEN